jgi:hypothetical protein
MNILCLLVIFANIVPMCSFLQPFNKHNNMALCGSKKNIDWIICVDKEGNFYTKSKTYGIRKGMSPQNVGYYGLWLEHGPERSVETHFNGTYWIEYTREFNGTHWIMRELPKVYK